ncbi:hypothetical protein VTK26DRAFT_5838 [Humicola hyalothermophila]
MAGSREQGIRGRSGSRRVYFTDEEHESTSNQGSPAQGNNDLNSPRGSGSSGRGARTSSTSHSQHSQHSSQQHSHANTNNSNRPGTPAAPTPVPSVGQNINPTPGHPGMAAPIGNPAFMTAQPAASGPSMPPMPRCPPDPLGPPPPPPPPPAIPPVLNPLGVHFQPPVPATDKGPMVHRYIPRFDPPGACYPAPQVVPYMTTGTQMPMQPLQPLTVAPMTAPINPVVIQQPVTQPMMVQNPVVGPAAPVAGQPLMIQGATVPGNPPFGPQLSARPPVHVEPALGVGLTPNETMAQNIRIAQNNKCYEPQDFRPADPDPYRMYWIRELNGHWAVFPRRQIDRLDVRWFRTDEGVFYAVRLSDSVVPS